ncbi:hypothetical protein FA15DRAFT_653559 [Coprinopsis marcescibilis]|uniref:Uncharacterized protein n=1 Tax=Coprinopsis marcescibilis TaxID=230819 RepID=A0A5C3L396_COPMA|nr:hypothetical protein FA15DRAFT_653559 [Coprinopsis marcescibilis]
MHDYPDNSRRWYDACQGGNVRWRERLAHLSMSITGLISAAEGTLSTLDALVLAHILVIPDVASLLSPRNCLFLAYVPDLEGNMQQGGAGRNAMYILSHQTTTRLITAVPVPLDWFIIKIPENPDDC